MTPQIKDRLDAVEDVMSVADLGVRMSEATWEDDPFRSAEARARDARWDRETDECLRRETSTSGDAEGTE
jgi:hypothetical protein